MTVPQAQSAIAYSLPTVNYANPTGPQVSAIALLIDLAERGEIDPWDVQVIDAIDRCLNEIAALSNAQDGFGIADLSQSGQAFVDASLLVLLKANTLERLQFADEDNPDSEIEEDWSDIDDSDGTGLPRNLERQLRRRPAAQPPSYRRVTLQELIEQLQLVAAAIAEKPPRPRAGSTRSYSQARTQAVRAALELVREENSVEIAAELERFLAIYGSGLLAKQDWLDLEHLLMLWAQRRNHENSLASVPAPDADSAESQLPPPYAIPSSDLSSQEQLHDRVGIFWALLLLSAQSKVELVQEEFYQDLRIRTLRSGA
ncbi:MULTISPECIES: segregation/condensation protein A [Aerosakkonema]|uniref:segregation/condensation protein A n=1 Tax=Aerosakkonema TaxID=1246629 RepID=UPI0035B708F4